MKENFQALLAGKVKSSTKFFIAALILLPGVAKIGPIAAFLSVHPSLYAVVESLIGIAALLHEPQIRTLLGIQTEIASTTSPDGTVTDTTKETTVIQK